MVLEQHYMCLIANTFIFDSKYSGIKVGNRYYGNLFIQVHNCTIINNYNGLKITSGRMTNTSKTAVNIISTILSGNVNAQVLFEGSAFNVTIFNCTLRGPYPAMAVEEFGVLFQPYSYEGLDPCMFINLT